MSKSIRYGIGQIKHYIRIMGAYVIQRMCELIPINKKVIVLYAYKRKGLCCNPKYILLELLKDNTEEYKLYWVAEYPETVKENGNFKVIKKRSIKYYLICSVAKVYITNDIVDETLIKRKGQIYINTWHGGGAFKKAGYDIAKNSEEERLVRIWYGKIDYMIVSSQYLAEKFQEAFQLKKSEILRIGMPRSDIFFQKNTLYKDIRKRYGISAETKIVLYAPTYRYTEYNLLSETEMVMVLDALKNHFGGDWLFLVRTHCFDQKNHFTYIPNQIICCNDYNDTQELLCGIDFMITDYSSLLWDFSILERPCFSYAPEPDKYANNERDFYIPYEKWPYPKSQNVQQLICEIENYDEEKYQDSVKKFINYLVSYDHGNSSKKFVEILKNQLI